MLEIKTETPSLFSIQKMLYKWESQRRSRAKHYHFPHYQ
jgi:hypothetical protein